MVKFTDSQKEVIKTVDGNVCAIASAGSGKTSSFVTRIALMLKQGIDPSKILAITFTKKASEEMQKRLVKMVGKTLAKQVIMGTTHAIFYRLLRENIDGFDKLNIIPEWNKYQILNDLISDFDEKKNPNGLSLGCSISDLSFFFSYQKANGVRTFSGIIMDSNTEAVNHISKGRLTEAFKRYEQIKGNGRQIDFDDIMLKMLDSLERNEEFREIIQSKYSHIMIDEFQDSSKIVMDIVKLINDKNVFVVGDFRQSIYSFINARVENILNFSKNFDDVKLVEMHTNFRSSKEIVEFSNQIINNSPIPSFKDYKMSESFNGESNNKVVITAYADEYNQSKTICRNIEKLVEDGVDPKEIAILFRTNSESADYEDILTQLDIPYIVSKSVSFYDRNEIVDVLSYAQLAVDRHNDSAIRRIYNKPNRYLSKKVLADLEKFAKDNDISLYTAFKTSPMRDNWSFKRNADNLINIIDSLATYASHAGNAGDVIKKALSLSRYIEDEIIKKDGTGTAHEKETNIEKLQDSAKKFPNVKALLVHISKVKEKSKKQNAKTPSVTLSTIHSAKGLEWDYTYVISVSNGNIPHEQNYNNIEEERRLLYVACSRPRKQLHVSWYSMKISEDKNGDVRTLNLRPSVFIQELISNEKASDMSKKAFTDVHGCSLEYNLDMNNVVGVETELGYEVEK